MGLTKDYLKFVQAGTCNLIGSPDGAVRCVDNLTCAVMAAESILFYNMRTLEKTYEIRCEANIVTAFEMSPDKTMIAIGYNNGAIHLHKTQQEDAKIVFMGHKTGVNSIAFSNDGFTLATGGKDSLIVLWDVLNESGICRFFGHKGSITQLKFAQNDRFLLSSSKDSTIRFWSIESKSCFYTLAESSTEIYSFALINNDRLLIIGNAEIELLICELSWEKMMNTDDESKAKNPRIEKIYENNMDEQANNILRSTRIGTLMRQAKGRALQIIVSNDESIICCIGSDSLMDVFRHFTAEESRKRFNKKLRKMRQKMEIQDETALLKLEEEVNKDITTLITRIGDFRADSKIKSIDFCDPFNLDASGNIREFRLYCLLRTNDVQGISLKIDWKSNSTESIKLASLGTRIHRTDVRTLSFSSDGTFFGSGSQESAIIWDAETLMPLNKFTADGLNLISASLITPDDKHFILGTKTGSIYLFNIQKCELIEKYEKTHNGMINQFFLCPQNDGFISCGQDKICKFWKFEIKEEIHQGKKMNLKSKRLLELPDEALCASISPNNKFIAFGLLDNTARVYFMDTLKFFVSLYGHSLAIYSIDISLDSKLVITGSADKSVKIWGLDFGDCHKSIFAHDDTVNCVKFSTNKDDENLFWSAGKDGKIKQWDAIKFNHIQTLQGHNDQIDSLILNSDGNILISASRDKSIRIWELSEEIIVLQEEDEKLREKDYEEKLVEEEDILPGEEKEPIGDLAPLKSIETIKSTESIIETIEIIRNERNEKANPMHKRHVLLNSYASNSEHLFLLDTINKIRSSHLEKSLLGLPFGYIPDLLEGMCECIQNSYRPETASKVINFILRIHHNEIIHSLELLSIVHNLKKELPTQLNSFLTRTGFNIAALKLMQMEIEKQQNTKIFDLNVDKEKKRKKKKFKRSN